MSIFIATCGPTGIGKTYQMQRLIAAQPEMYASVLSVTTRARRGAEDDRWYTFVSRNSLANLDQADVVSDVTFRDERYVLLRSEIRAALLRAPVVFMAIVPTVIMKMRTQQIPHVLVNCRVGDWSGYRERLEKRGYHGDALERELAQTRAFLYPANDLTWPSIDLELGSNVDDNRRFQEVIDGIMGMYA